jgi:dTDP-4-amino-4,6-dideoxygalactose transaminase
MQGSCSEMYLEKAFDGLGVRPEVGLPNAVALGETSMMFMVHPTLTDANMGKAVQVITDVMGQASGH